MTLPFPLAGRGAPYIVPFAVFLLLLVVGPLLPPQVDGPFRLIVLSLVLWHFSRGVIDFKSRLLLPSSVLGVLVFFLWIAPDVLIPNYRDFWLFQNQLTGTLHSSIPAVYRTDPFVLTFRIVRSVLLVPVIEELFWRGWLMRWLISADFERVPLGAYAPASFFITAFLFSLEHGPFWDVGLLCGLIYNWWMVRTRSLGDCILVHAVTNACLAGYVLATHRWEYWL